ncbi:hypothetical protein NFI96_010837 [Prochilodus magdalenae]|nr:hypothetical protein NFI96_010837 [Prochilodus magdalenae]
MTSRTFIHQGVTFKNMAPGVAYPLAPTKHKTKLLSQKPVNPKDADLTDEDAAFSEPSSSCSFDGSLKSENSDSEPKWPELPPILNQNEERRRNKYLRKDYLKLEYPHTVPADGAVGVEVEWHQVFWTCETQGEKTVDGRFGPAGTIGEQSRVWKESQAEIAERTKRMASNMPEVSLEHSHTVPADGAVGVEVECHQDFWTCETVTTVPPHTDSLGLVIEDDPLPFRGTTPSVFGVVDVVVLLVNPWHSLSSMLHVTAYVPYKCQSARRNSTDNDCEEAMRSADFSTTLTVFGLKPRSAFTRSSRQEYGSTDPSFTMRRKMEHLREEMEQIRLLRQILSCPCLKLLLGRQARAGVLTQCGVLPGQDSHRTTTEQNLESRLKVLLPEDVGAALMDGVVLCHLANHIRPRSVASIHVPSPAVPKLSMAKCRRNVENFLEACKKLGVPQDKLCLPHHILEERGLVKVGVTVQALLDLPSSKPTQLSTM